jgi:stearoyl-CoA desaturase (Delta-9 desaturase)
LGNYSLNVTTAFIDFFAKIGWAYDLKTVSHDVISKRIERTGDGSHESHRWGWNDASAEEKKMATIVNKKD